MQPTVYRPGVRPNDYYRPVIKAHKDVLKTLGIPTGGGSPIIVKAITLDPDLKLPNLRPPRKFWGPKIAKPLKEGPDKAKPNPQPVSSQPSGPKGKGAKGGSVKSTGYELFTPPPIFSLGRSSQYKPSMTIGGRLEPS